MSINTSLLIAAPVLQDYLVDKATGLPLVAGIITCYQDSSRTTLKNWYYQTGVPGNYTYITLPNPMTLSAVGTIMDGNGNDVIPFFYPYDETNNVTKQAYYITVDSSAGTRQFSRQNFPFIPEEPTPESGIPTLKNYLVNNVFWRNVGSAATSSTTLVSIPSSTFTIGGSSFYGMTLCPSQHDGYCSQLSDISYIANANDETTTITFTKFSGTSSTEQQLQGDVTPEFYLNYHCTVEGTATAKYIVIPLSLHINSLSDANGTVTVQAMNVGGAASNEISVSILQFLGTGTTASTVSTLSALSLTNSWTKYSIPCPIPTAVGQTVGQGGDDALYIILELPSGEAVNVNIAVPSFYLSNTVPTNNFTTYDEVGAVIDSPRTGDTRTSLNQFAPFGWVACNDGTIGSGSTNTVNSHATNRSNIDTFPLYSLIWNNVGVTYAPIYTSAGVNSSYGASAVADFAAGKQLALTKVLGKVLAGMAPNIVTAITYTVSHGVSTSNLIIPADGSGNSQVTYMPTGTPVVLTNSGGAAPTGLTVGVIYYAYSVDATHIKLCPTIADALAGTNPLTFTVDDGSGTNKIQPCANYIDATHINKLGYERGEESHILTSAQLPNPLTTTAATKGATLDPLSQEVLMGGNGDNHAGKVDNTGGGQGHNTMQPTTYFNIFLKL